MMSSGFGGFVSKPFSLFGLLGLLRSFAAAAVAILGKSQTCAVQTWSLAGVIIATTILKLIFRPYNTAFVLVLSTTTSIVSATIIILNQFDGLDDSIQQLTIDSTWLVLAGTCVLLIVKLLGRRWRASELESIRTVGDSDPLEIPLVDGQSQNALASSFASHERAPEVASPLLLVPLSSTSTGSPRRANLDSTIFQKTS